MPFQKKSPKLLKCNVVQGINKNEETRRKCQKSKHENVDYRQGLNTV